ncbi:hypothetical protein SCUP515_07249 [Seiridium cupressi]
MQLTSLITAAGLAVSTTSAFLLPPLPESSESDTVTTLPVPVDTDLRTDAPLTAEIQKLELPCPGCPIRVGHHRGNGDKTKAKTNIPSHLELAFTIDHAADHDRLMVNDFVLYPRSPRTKNTPSASYSLGAQLLPDHKHSKDDKHKLPGHRKQHKPTVEPLGYALSATPVAKSTEDDMELVEVDFQVIEVGNVFVDGIPTVEIKVIKTPEGGLLIGGIETTASESLMKGPVDNQDQCVTMLCRWRAMLNAQMGRFRSGKCGGGRRPGHTVGQGTHGHPHSGHRQQHRHRFVNLLRNIASHIILPIAVGIAAGITASVIGMMVGTAIVFLWRTLIRPAGTRRHHHRRGHSSRKTAQSETVVEEEKTGLMSHQEDAVEAPPAYVEEGLVGNDKTTENEA